MVANVNFPFADNPEIGSLTRHKRAFFVTHRLVGRKPSSTALAQIELVSEPILRGNQTSSSSRRNRAVWRPSNPALAAP
jgi:hypothetical protein